MQAGQDATSQCVSAYMQPPSWGAINVGWRHSKGVNVVWADLHTTWVLCNTLLSGKGGSVDYYYRRVKWARP